MRQNRVFIILAHSYETESRMPCICTSTSVLPYKISLSYVSLYDTNVCSSRTHIRYETACLYMSTSLLTSLRSKIPRPSLLTSLRSRFLRLSLLVSLRSKKNPRPSLLMSLRRRFLQLSLLVSLRKIFLRHLYKDIPTVTLIRVSPLTSRYHAYYCMIGTYVCRKHQYDAEPHIKICA